MKYEEATSVRSSKCNSNIIRKIFKIKKAGRKGGFFMIRFILFCLLAAVNVLTILGHELNVKKTFGEDELFKPQQIIASGDEIFILDRGDETIKTYSGSGTLKQTLGGRGAGPGQFILGIVFDISNDRIYVIDTGQNRIHVFLQNEKKYLRSIKFPKSFLFWNPITFHVFDDGKLYAARPACVKDDKLIVKLNKEFKTESSFLSANHGYQNMNQFNAEKKITVEMFVNQGYIGEKAGKIYFAYHLLNSVLEISRDGKILNRYSLPLPSIDKTVKIKTFSNGSADLERRLNYDLKIRDDHVYVLSRNEQGHSIVFMLQNGEFKELCRMKEELMGFDILNGKLYGIHDGEEGIYVYALEK